MWPVAALPTGTVTFLLTDVEGSTRRWEESPAAMKAAMERHDAPLQSGIERHGGAVLKSRGEGDSFFAVFERAQDAVLAAAQIQARLQAEMEGLSVRMALHSGEAEVREGDYFGTAVNRCARLRAIAHGGQVLLSWSAAALVRETLPAEAVLKDLGVHRLRDLTEPEHVYQLLVPGLQSDFGALLTLDGLPNNLPVQLSTFVGRERELAELKQLLGRTRMLTLVGVGGSGKTRLALQLAAAVSADYADGAWLVELAPLGDAELLPQTVAAALGLRRPGLDPLELLLGFLGSKHLLLVLDNCEHLVDASATLAGQLLRAAPGLRIVATSQEALSIPGEQAWRVPSLTLPNSNEALAPEQLTQCEAVRLFLDRATSSRSDFALTEANAPAVAQICAQLDGIPLALELAASRVNLITPEQILERLEERFRLLTGGSRTANLRHKTLRAAVDWSYELLGASEQLLLRRLAVFPGGFSLEAAEGVSAGGPMDRESVLELLGRLVGKSLVVAEAGRYRLLDTIRAYCRERMQEAAELEAMLAAHAGYFAARAEAGESSRKRAAQVTMLEWLEVELDNVRAAFDWASVNQPCVALAMGGALFHFWNISGRFREGERRLTTALSACPGETLDRVRALAATAMIASNLGQLERALEFIAEAEPMARRLGDPRRLALVLNIKGLATVGGQQRTTARQAWEEGVTVALEADDLWGVAMMRNNLGLLAVYEGRPEEARPLLESSLDLMRRAGERHYLPAILDSLAKLLVSEGDWQRAAALWVEAIQLTEPLRDRWGLPPCLEGLALVAALSGQIPRALQLRAGAGRVRDEIGMVASDFSVIDRLEDVLVAGRASLGEADAASAEERGRALTIAELVALAVGDQNWAH